MKLLHTIAQLLLIPILFLSFSSSALAAKKEKSREAVIPLEQSKDGLFTLKINVNNKNDVPVILDTAAGMSALKKSTVSDLNLTKFGTDRLVHGLIGREIADTVKVDLFSAGAMEQSGPVLIIEDNDAISDDAIEGLIGMDLLASNAEEHRYLMLNFPDHKIVTSSSLGALGDRNKLLGLQWTKLIKLEDDFNFLSFPVRVSGIKATAIIDTGINFTVINQPLADELEKKGRVVQNHVYTDFNGEEDTMRHLMVGKIKSSQITWGQTRALIFDPPAIDRLGLADEASVLLGLSHLYNLAIVIDRKTQKIAFISDAVLKRPGNLCSASRPSCFGGSGFSYSQ